MPRRKPSILERVVGRLDDLDAVNLSKLAHKLARERRLLETVFQTMHEGIIVIDTDGVIEYANASAMKFIGLSSKEFGKAILWKMVPELARTLDFTSDGQFAAQSVVSREMELTYPENRYIRFYLLPFPHREGEGEGDRCAIILSDVTEEKITTRELIESEKVSSLLMLAAGVAHELGNPINSLTIHLQLLRRRLDKMSKGKANDNALESVDICVAEVERLDGIITHFLEAIRPSPPDLQDLDLANVLEEVLEFQGRELKCANISVDMALADKTPIILGDRNQIKGVFFNILNNARDSMSGGGKIKVNARSDDEFVFIQIGDTGTGIEQENLSKVFEPYFTTRESGHGLGMMIAQRIMRDHGGQIGIDSQEGVGTVVTLQFPQEHRRVRLLKN